MLKAGGRGVSRAAGALTSPVWLLLGGANLIAGFAIALRPDQSFDLTTVAEWCREWIAGANPYPGSTLPTNYPPYALVLLSPLAIVPAGVLKATWAAVSVALFATAAWLGLKVMPAASVRGTALRLSMGLFLSWESVRIGLGLGQFTLLPLVAGLAAVLYTGTIGRGLLLGVAMIKPQIGVAFVIWAILDGSIAAAVWAAAPAILGTLLFAARLGQSPLAVIGGFMAVIREELRAPGFREGSLELRPLFHDLIPQATVADAVHLIVAVGSLAIIVVVSRLMTASNRARFLLPLTCLWTLMSIYHPTYDLVMLWPAFVALFAWYVDSGAKPLALGAIAAIQIALVVDVPGLWWKWNGRPFPVGDHGLLTTTILHFDRLLVSALFTMLVALSLRWQSSREPVTLANPVPVS